MSEKFYPALFVLLWASAFISAAYGLTGSGAFSYLFVRFVFVALLFGLMVLAFRAPWPRRHEILPTVTVGVLMHGIYLGGVFFAISLGTSAGVAALIASSHPIVTAMLARPLTGEKVSLLQWAGIALGFGGVIAVVWPQIGTQIGTQIGDGLLGGDLPILGLATLTTAAIAMALATVMQKRFVGGVDLISGNTIQAAAAVMFFGLLLIFVETFHFEMTAPVILSLIWVVVFVSLGAISILMLMIRKGRMASVSSLFFLVPPVSAILDYLLFDERLGLLEIAGFVVASIGVWLVNRQPERLN